MGLSLRTVQYACAEFEVPCQAFDLARAPDPSDWRAGSWGRIAMPETKEQVAKHARD
jgi:hypothetical protein